jgi:hypothetical protein
MLFLCIERIVGLTSGCRILERIFAACRSITVIPVHSTGRGWGSFKRKRELTLCYNCRRLGHLAKACPGIGPICLCCKDVGHEVLDCPRMIAKVEKMNLRQENYEEGQETKDMLENQKESETILLQMK